MAALTHPMATTTSFQELLDAFTEVIGQNDEQAAKDFLIAHLKEFPEGVQEEIITAFVEDAMERTAAKQGETVTLQKKMLDEFDALGRAEQILEDQEKLRTLKESL